MGNTRISSIIGFAVGKAVFIGVRAFLQYHYYSVLTLLVVCAFILTSIILTYIPSLTINPTVSGTVMNAIRRVNSLDDLTQAIVQASLIFAIVGAIIDFVGNYLFRHKKRAEKYAGRKKAYLISAGIFAVLAASASVSIVLEANNSDRITPLIIVLLILLLSFAALFLLRFLNRLIDSMSLLIQMIKPMGHS